MKAQDLIQIAKLALAEENNIEACLNSIEQYTSEFDLWLQQDSSASEPEDVLLELSSIHSLMLELGNRLKENTLLDIQSHKKRARGIMSYVDRLPRSIQIGTKKKG